MAPKFLHQSFTSNNRLEITFDDSTCPLYVATESDDSRWLDTQLLPVDSELYQAIHARHVQMLIEQIRPFEKLVEAWSEFSPYTKVSLFTFRVGIRILPNTEVLLEILCGVNSSRLPLSNVSQIQASTREKAEAMMHLWQCENIYAR